jgi:serine/threonine protein kinase
MREMSDRSGATRSDAVDPLIGRTINDRFTITRLIARGGMGKVYLAEQAPLGRLCAIKVLNPSYNGSAEPEFHRRFFLEASVTSKLSHPNTVTIFDYGVTDDEYYFMAMEYLEGQTLHQAIRKDGLLPEARAVNIVSQICRGLREAHAIGVIHRDLKPANIFPRAPRRRARFRQNPRLRLGEERPRQGRGSDHPDRPLHGLAEVHGARANPRGPRSMHAPTCTRWAWCSARCSRAVSRSIAPRA